MKNQLIAHIEQLFTGAALNRENLELKEEITRNTLERYDDLIAQGTAPEEAFRIAAENIGNIHTLLRNPPPPNQQPPVEAPAEVRDPQKKKGRGPVCGAINGAIWALTIVGYVLVSQWTQKWEITWVLFLMAVAATGIVEAIFDLCQGGAENEEK